jgi:uncharacterized membrane protein
MDAPHSDLETIRRLLADLTTRVHNIERKLGIEDGAPPARVSSHEAPIAQQPAGSAPPAAIPHTAVTPAAPIRSQLAVPYPIVPQASPRWAHSQRHETDLESRIGSHWLNRIGIAALLIGVSYFLKFAFDNNWIGPTGRIAIGLLAGVGIVIWSERFRAKGYQAFSYSLKAVGIGALYLSLWAAFQVYALISGGTAFVMMFAVTAAAAAMAWAQEAELLAAFALAGGFSTPVLLSTGQNREIALFSYVLLLDFAALALVIFKPWSRLLVLSFAGTLLIYIGWYARFYNESQLAPTLVSATLFFIIFAIVPVVTRPPASELAQLASVLALLSFANAVVYFLQAYAMINPVDSTYMAWFALALAAVYIFLSAQIRKRSIAKDSPVLHQLHLVLALAFITVAVPIRLSAHWITIGWFVEAGVLLWIADRIKSDLLNVFALGALALGVVRLLLIDNFETTRLIFNMRFVTYLVAVAVLGAVAFYSSRRADEAGRQVAAVAVVALNVLMLTALSHEVADYYSRQLGELHAPFARKNAGHGNEWHRIEIERDFTYSALWMAYGAVLMAIGFVRRSAFARWQALVLIAATTLKVFIYDVSELDRAYRIVSFIVLGALLLAISFAYQRDWLKLSTPSRIAEGGGSKA